MQLEDCDGKIFTIEGSIGVGKTTICSSLAEDKGNISLYEKNFETLLQLFVDPSTRKQYGALFQNYMLSEVYWRLGAAINILQNNPNSEKVFLDRSPWGNRSFYDINASNGTIDQYGQSFYETLFKASCAIPMKSVNTLIFLYAPAKTCMDRIKLRNREQEKGYTEAYLVDLEIGFLKQLIDHFNVENTEKHYSVVVLDWRKYGNKDDIYKNAINANATKNRPSVSLVKSSDFDESKFKDDDFINISIDNIECMYECEKLREQVFVALIEKKRINIIIVGKQ